MAPILLALAFVGAVATHYEKPPCQSDEVAGKLQSGGELCAPACTSGKCPTDVPAGTTAKPQCVLQTGPGKKYCGLICKADTACPKGAKCYKTGFVGICAYPAGFQQGEAMSAAPCPKALFKEFMEKFDRVYATAEDEERRFQIFKDNLEKIKDLQRADGDADYSHLTPFADWTSDEFKGQNTLKPVMAEPTDIEHDVSDLPSDFDWRAKGAVNPVKNQQQCGSCWAFATVANIEGVNFVKNSKLLSLSEQELVDCDKTTGDEGCQGGLPQNAYEDMIKNHIGLELESAYPYKAADGKCQASKAKEQVFITNYTMISTNEDQIAAALIKYGPLAIGINAGPMQHYSGGIASPWRLFCNPKKLDHGVAIVGFGEDSGKKYWIIRNSWGPAWGEKGYYRIVRGKGACGLNTMVSTAVMGSASSAEIVV